MLCEECGTLARLVLPKPDTKYTRSAYGHDHPAQPGITERIPTTKAIHQKAKENVFTSAANNMVMTQGTVDLGAPAATRPVPVNVGSANYQRSMGRPTAPTDLEFDIDMAWVDPDFLRKDLRVSGARHLIFATSTQLDLLSTASTIFFDDTFKVMSPPFYQLFSVHAFLHDTNGQEMKQVPLIFALMSRRRKKDYKAVLRAVLELAPLLAPEMVTDFEDAIRRAAAHALPDVAVHGFNFHFSQALLRQVGELGLKRAYCKQGIVQDYIKLLFALPYLPKEHIRSTFNRIAEWAHDALKPLISYVDKQWFHKFTPGDWCVYRQTTCTNNDVEGWHNRLNMKARTANLNFYVLVQLLKGESNMVPLQCQLLKEDKIKKWQPKQTAATQGNLWKLWKQHRKRDISTHQLLKQLGHVAAPTEVKKWYPPQPRLSRDLLVPG